MKFALRRFARILVPIGPLCSLLLIGSLLPIGAFAMSGGTKPHCPDRYPQDTFRVCYYSGTDPATGAYLGTETEGVLNSASVDDAFGIDRNWGTGVVFAGLNSNISAKWKGRLEFSGGDYIFTFVNSDGARMFIDEELVLDEWGNSGLGRSVAAVPALSAGGHDVRIEWYEGPKPNPPDSARIQMHWSKVPDVGTPVVSDIKINVYLVTKLDTCIEGVPWDGVSNQGQQVNLKNIVGGAPAWTWQYEGASPKPTGYKPSEFSPTSGLQSDCFTFEFKRDPDPALDEVEIAKQAFDKFAAQIEEYSFGKIVPTLEFIELEGEFGMESFKNGTSSAGLWTPWTVIEAAAEASTGPVTRETDFVFVVNSLNDLQEGLFHDIPFCGNTAGFSGSGTPPGAGFSWMGGPGSQCLNDGVALHEWEHQMYDAVQSLMGIEGGPVYQGWNEYPPCGQGDPDTYLWYPWPDKVSIDPDSPWCGPETTLPGAKGLVAHSLAHHFDASLSHYALDHLTGNHCDNHIQDYVEGETGVDTGPTCPTGANAYPVVTIASPADGSTFEDGTPILFSGSAYDDEDGSVTSSLEWYSDQLENAIGYGASFTTTLPVGQHVISAVAFDSASDYGEATISISVEPLTGVGINSPADFSRFLLGDPITFSANAIDLEGRDISSSVVWTSDRDGHLFDGPSFTTSQLSLFHHVITATATDIDGNMYSAVVHVEVYEVRPCHGKKCGR